MSNVLSVRLGKLEKLAQMGNPLALLSDEELEARLRTVTARAEAVVGMPLHEFGAALWKSLDAGEPIPHDWTQEEARHFAHLCMRNAH